jgi:hypothetical protein
VSLDDIRIVLDAEAGDADRRELALSAVDRKQTELEAQFAELRAARDMLLASGRGGRGLAAQTGGSRLG